jgi:hypothetical protein
VGVDLRRRDVGVAEHLLQRPQVAAAGEQVRGERVAQRVRAHAVVQPDGAGVALDDLVEPLAGKARAAAVDEDPRLVAQPDERRPPAFEVGARGGDCLAADRHEALLRSLPACPQDAGAQVEVAQLEPRGLGGAQAAGVHQLEQRPVPQRRRPRPARGAEQLGDLVPAEDLGQPLALARRAQVGGRVVRECLLAAQVAVERAQARRLALQRRRRDGRAVAALLAQLLQEAGEIRVLGIEHVHPAASEVEAELQEVGPVGLERVARQPALELEVCEEVEHLVLEAGRRRLGDGHASRFAPWAAVPCAARRRARAVDKAQATSRPPSHRGQRDPARSPPRSAKHRSRASSVGQRLTFVN